MPEPSRFRQSLPLAVVLGLVVSWLSLVAIALLVGGLAYALGYSHDSTEIDGIQVAIIVGLIFCSNFVALAIGGRTATRINIPSSIQPAFYVGVASSIIVTAGVSYQQGYLEAPMIFVALVSYLPGSLVGGALELRRAA